MLGSNGILKAIEKGDIWIYPFNIESLQPNSYDVSLDTQFYTLRKVNSRYRNLYIVTGDPSLELLWYGPRTMTNSYGNFIEIEPHSMILAATAEIVGAYRNYTTLLKAKSTIARLCLDICASAGFGDVGFVNKWTLEIVNHSDRLVHIPVGTKVAQVAFSPIEGQGDVYSGSYLQQKEWTPEQMLPVVKPSMFLKGL